MFIRRRGEEEGTLKNVDWMKKKEGRSELLLTHVRGSKCVLCARHINNHTKAPGILDLVGHGLLFLELHGVASKKPC